MLCRQFARRRLLVFLLKREKLGHRYRRPCLVVVVVVCVCECVGVGGGM